MKKVLLILFTCCMLLYACGEEKNEAQLLTVRWKTVPLKEIYTDLVSAYCKTEEAADELEEALRREIATFSCKTNEEVTACARTLCNVLIEYGCLPASWVPIEANHYLNGIWSIGFAPREDEEMLRDSVAGCLDLTNRQILSYDGMRYIYFECTQAEVYRATTTLPVQSCDIAWIYADLNILLNEENGETEKLTIEASMCLDDKRVQSALLSANLTVPLDSNKVIMEYDTTLRSVLRRYGYLERDDIMCYVERYMNDVLRFHYISDTGGSTDVLVCSHDGHVMYIK